MGLDDDNPHQWFTAGEGALIADACQVPGVPRTREGMTKLFKRLAAADPDTHAAMSRRRTGQKGGGGTEFHWSCFPEALWNVLDAEVSRRERAEVISRDALAASEWGLTPDDEQFMRGIAFDLFGSIPSFERPRARRVRRSWVVVDGYRYCSRDLDQFEGRDALVVLPVVPYQRPAFIWSIDPETERLAAHGKDGFICVTEPGWLWLPGTRPRRNAKE